MKKNYFIFFLIAFLFGTWCGKIYCNQLKNIDIKVKNDELALILLHLPYSDSILIKTKESYLLYIFRFEHAFDLKDYLSPFTEEIDYVFTKEEYSFSYPHKIVANNFMIVEDVMLERNRIHYHDYTFCINETKNCDFTYVTEEITFQSPIETLFYTDDLSISYVDRLHNEWIDFYKVTKDSYTILLLSDDYEIIHLQR